MFEWHCKYTIDPFRADVTNNYVTALAGGKTKGELEAANSNQRRFGYIRSLKYLVMLGARIDVVEAPIWNFKAYLLGVGVKIDSCMNRDSMFLRFESIQKF